jgi:hypothetical protein
VNFLEEYSHCPAPELFLTACAVLTKQIRVGFGLRDAPRDAGRAWHEAHPERFNGWVGAGATIYWMT